MATSLGCSIEDIMEISIHPTSLAILVRKDPFYELRKDPHNRTNVIGSSSERYLISIEGAKAPYFLVNDDPDFRHNIPQSVSHERRHQKYSYFHPQYLCKEPASVEDWLANKQRLQDQSTLAIETLLNAGDIHGFRRLIKGGLTYLVGTYLDELQAITEEYITSRQDSQSWLYIRSINHEIYFGKEGCYKSALEEDIESYRRALSGSGTTKTIWEQVIFEELERSKYQMRYLGERHRALVVAGKTPEEIENIITFLTPAQAYLINAFLKKGSPIISDVKRWKKDYQGENYLNVKRRTVRFWKDFILFASRITYGEYYSAQQYARESFSTCLNGLAELEYADSLALKAMEGVTVPLQNIVDMLREVVEQRIPRILAAFQNGVANNPNLDPEKKSKILSEALNESLDFPDVFYRLSTSYKPISRHGKNSFCPKNYDEIARPIKKLLDARCEQLAYSATELQKKVIAGERIDYEELFTKDP
ncbi:hypothetical protein HYU95_03140 [Candidatus Daviesbacteria bacterium]|nr:hypothetical protein [Candidatus Daviesbacteria bacterium]